MFGKLGMMQAVSIGAVVAAVAGWAIYTQTDLIRPTPVVEAGDGPIAVEAQDQGEVSEETVPVSEAADPDVADETEAEDAVVAETSEAEETEQSVETEEEMIVSPPAFDVVRVESDGMTVIAGTGPAGWMISILVDGVVVETVEADANGQFVAILDIGESETARVVTLSAKNADQILLSDAQVIIAPVVRQVASLEDDAAESSPEESAAGSDEVAEADATSDNAESEDTAEANTSEVSEDTTAPSSDGDAVQVSETEAAEATEEPAVVEGDSDSAVVSTTEDMAADSSTDGEQVETVTSETESSVAQESSSDDGSAETQEDSIVAADTVVAEETTVTEGTAPVDAQESSDEESSEAEASEQEATETVSEDVVTESSPAVLLVEGDDVQVLQPASDTPVVMDQLSIAAISYSDDGAVQLSGISPAGFLRVYLNNVAIMELIVPEPGSWNAELSDVEPGVYTLRVDQIGENGDVLQRVETPFKREEPAKVIEAAQTRRPLVSVEVVQPGSTLWAISRENYGSGVLFVRIFEANKNQIRNPDLIYPGQIFDLPAPPGAKKKKRTSGQ